MTVTWSPASTSQNDSEVPPYLIPNVTHTLTSKCIGATRSSESQDALKKVSELSREGHKVPVNIFREPENPVDSRAIAFRRNIGDKWYTIGYIVKEALEHVHTAIQNKSIISINFSWVKYLVVWTWSGPGYAGINITIRGRWPCEDVQCASTR